MTRPVLVVGVDPGKSVGVAALLDGQRLGAWQFDVATGDASKLEQVLNELFEKARTNDYRLLVACEKFVVNARTSRITQQTEALVVTGTLRSLSPVPIVMQSVSDASRLVPNTKLKTLGLWVKASEVGCPDADDANSAMRHAVLLLARRAARVYVTLLERHGLV